MIKFFKNPWVIGIGSSFVAAIILGIADKVFETTILKTISGGIKIAVTWFFALKLKVWIVLIIVLMVFWITAIIYSKATKDLPVSKAPPFVDEYTSDIFEEIRWRWQWYHDMFANKYKPEKFREYCPQCDTALVPKHFGGILKCPNCQKSFRPQENDQCENRLALIERHVREEWPIEIR